MIDPWTGKGSQLRWREEMWSSSDPQQELVAWWVDHRHLSLSQIHLIVVDERLRDLMDSDLSGDDRQRGLENLTEDRRRIMEWLEQQKTAETNALR
ncbi:MAG: hypothetical protein AAGH88_15710 [Planctomycetota bacterium]